MGIFSQIVDAPVMAIFDAAQCLPFPYGSRAGRRLEQPGSGKSAAGRSLALINHQIINAYNQTRLQRRSRWLEEVSDLFLAASQEERELARISADADRLSWDDMVRQFDQVWSLLYGYALQINEILHWSQPVSVVRPALVSEHVPMGSGHAGFQIVQTYRAKLSTRHMSLVLRGLRDRIDVFLIESRETIGLSNSERSLSPHLTFEKACQGDAAVWLVAGQQPGPHTLKELSRDLLTALVAGKQAALQTSRQTAAASQGQTPPSSDQGWAKKRQVIDLAAVRAHFDSLARAARAGQGATVPAPEAALGGNEQEAMGVSKSDDKSESQASAEAYAAMNTMESTAVKQVCQGGCSQARAAGPAELQGNEHSRASLFSIYRLNRRLSIEMGSLSSSLETEVERLTLGGSEALKARRFADAENLCGRASELLPAQDLVNRLSSEWKVVSSHALVEESKTGIEHMPSNREEKESPLKVRQALSSMLQSIDALIRAIADFGSACMESRDFQLAQQVCTYAATVTAFKQKLASALAEDQSIDIRS